MPTRVRTRPTRSWRVVAAVLSAVVMLAASAACGTDEVRTDGQAPPTMMSMDRWSESIDRVCIELDDRFAELSGAELRTAEDAAEHAGAIEDYATRLRSAASRLAAASVERSVIADFDTSTVALADAASALAQATRAGDADAAADAVEAIGVAGDEINHLAEKLSLDGCVGF